MRKQKVKTVVRGTLAAFVAKHGEKSTVVTGYVDPVELFMTEQNPAGYQLLCRLGVLGLMGVVQADGRWEWDGVWHAGSPELRVPVSLWAVPFVVDGGALRAEMLLPPSALPGVE